MGFQDRAQPTSYLIPPEDYSGDVLGQPYASPAMALDWLSPSHVVSEFLKSIGGPDIFGEAAQALSGDWEKVYRTGVAFQKVAAAVPAIGFNVSSGNVELDALWDGNAADSSFMYFAELSAAISAQQLALFRLGELYIKAAEGVWRLQESVSGVLKDITDMCLIAMAEIAGGTALIETGVGAVAGYALAAAEIYKIFTAIERAKKLISTGAAVINTIVGEIQAVIGDVGDLKKFPLPGQSYHHPAFA